MTNIRDLLRKARNTIPIKVIHADDQVSFAESFYWKPTADQTIEYLNLRASMAGHDWTYHTATWEEVDADRALKRG